MIKNIKLLVFVLLLIFIFLKVLNITGIIRLVRISSSSNEPALKAEKLYFVSNLFKPKKLDFVLYTPDKPRASGDWIHRLCATENDTIEIKKGTLFVNNENIDKKLTLKYAYKIKINDFEKIKGVLHFNKNDIYKTNDSVFLALTKHQAEKNKKIKRHITQKINYDIYKVYSKKWNEDNFGPLTIPKGFVFILGDNRNFCIDSRLLGLIPVKKVKGKVLR